MHRLSLREEVDEVDTLIVVVHFILEQLERVRLKLADCFDRLFQIGLREVFEEKKSIALYSLRARGLRRIESEEGE